MKHWGFWILTCAATMLIAAAATTTRAEGKAAPKGNGTICFNAKNAGNLVDNGGIIRITARKEGKPDLDVPLPVPANATMAAIVGIFKALAPATWVEGTDWDIAGNCIVLKDINQLDGDPGDTKVQMTWVVSNGDVPTEEPPSSSGKKGKKVKGNKTGNGGRAGKFSIVAVIPGYLPGGEVAAIPSEFTVFFEAADSMAQIMSVAAVQLQAEGWDVTYDPAEPNEISFWGTPGGPNVVCVSLTVAYDTEDPTAEYHWAVSFLEEE